MFHEGINNFFVCLCKDDVTSEFEKLSKEQSEAVAIEKGASKEVIYTIDIPGKRNKVFKLCCFYATICTFVLSQQTRSIGSGRFM